MGFSSFGWLLEMTSLETSLEMLSLETLLEAGRGTAGSTDASVSILFLFNQPAFALSRADANATTLVNTCAQ